jgi:hypothetical protein
VFRTGLDTQLPLDPGASTVTFPALTEAERASYWRLALVRAGLAGDADALASRWRLAPGQIEDVIGRAAGRASTTSRARMSPSVCRMSRHRCVASRRGTRWRCPRR